MGAQLAEVDLYWLPLGAGGNFVRLSGRLYEGAMAAIQRRPRRDLYHSAIEVVVPEGHYTIEQASAAPNGEERGVVGVGPIGATWLADRFAMFHYELRCWPDGVIPDIGDAVEQVRLTTDVVIARRILRMAPQVPFLLWGRDDLHVGDMWNSNSQIAWLLTMSGIDAESIEPPPGGRAPGWRAGIVAAERRPTRLVA
jgi:hypothetical protein